MSRKLNFDVNVDGRTNERTDGRTDGQTDGQKFGLLYRKVQVGKDQEKAQSEKDSHSKNRGGKKPN